MPRYIHFSSIAQLLFSGGLALAAPATLRAQYDIPVSPDHPGSNPPDQKVLQSPVNIYVTVREVNGLALEHSATVTLDCPLAGLVLKGPTQNKSQVQFDHVPSGDCNVVVTSDGFKQTKERITVNESVVSRNQYVFVYLHPNSEITTPGARPVITPGLLDLMDKSAQDIRKNKLADARKHLDKALRISPSNPDVLYLNGLLAMEQQNLSEAQLQFQKAISAYPTHERSLLALGEVQVNLNQPEPAEKTMESLLRQDSSSWRAHLVAAAAYAQEKNYVKAEQHVDRAVSLSGANGAPAKVLLGQILAAQGNRDGAKQAYQEVLRDYPNDAVAAEAKTGIENLDNASRCFLLCLPLH